MAQETDFSLITVSPSEDEDVVIQAGLSSAPATPSASANSMVTTEEDLRAPVPFAGMQRAILAGFVLLVVVAIAYWFFIRPGL